MNLTCTENYNKHTAQNLLLLVSKIEVVLIPIPSFSSFYLLSLPSTLSILLYIPLAHWSLLFPPAIYLFFLYSLSCAIPVRIKSGTRIMISTFSMSVKQELADYSLLAKSSPLPVSINNVLLEHSSTYLFMYCLWLCLWHNSRTE